MIVIGGPTATGKTGLAVEVAKQLNGEIIGADSMQIYRHMDIGTAKPTKEEKQGIPHYMIDIINPTDKFSVAEYKKQTVDLINDIKERGHVPILVGGTGLYINSILYDYSPFVIDESIRKELRKEYEKYGADYMYEKLCSIDPHAGAVIHKNNVKRVLRAIEVKMLTGESLSSKCDREFTVPALTYILGDIEREELYDKINQRVDMMFVEGLEEEVDLLLKNKIANFDCQSMQAIGYKEFRSFYYGDESIETVKEKIKQHTRNYAKRQITWFKSLEAAIWLKVGENRQNSDRIVGDYYKYFCKL